MTERTHQTEPYLSADEVSDIRVDDDTPRNPYPSGYGRKVPTRYMLQLGKRWHRVYVMQYGNSGSAYVILGGQERFLHSDVEHDMYRAGQEHEAMKAEAIKAMGEVVPLLRTVGVEYVSDSVPGLSALAAEGKRLRAGVLYLENRATAAVAIGDDIIGVDEFTSPRGFANYIKGWILEKGTDRG